MTGVADLALPPPLAPRVVRGVSGMGSGRLSIAGSSSSGENSSRSRGFVSLLRKEIPSPVPSLSPIFVNVRASPFDSRAVRARRAGSAMARGLSIDLLAEAWAQIFVGQRGGSCALGQAERVAVVAVGIARCDQQCPVADHLREVVPHPLGRARVLDAIRQALGDPEP